MAQQTSRQWIVTHEWMVKPMQQTEWIKGEGLLIWLAEVFSSLGTGLYLVSIIMNNWWGALFGWGIIVLIKLPFTLFTLAIPCGSGRCCRPFQGRGGPRGSPVDFSLPPCIPGLVFYN